MGRKDESWPSFMAIMGVSISGMTVVCQIADEVHKGLAAKFPMDLETNNGTACPYPTAQSQVILRTVTFAEVVSPLRFNRWQLDPDSSAER